MCTIDSELFWKRERQTDRQVDREQSSIDFGPHPGNPWSMWYACLCLCTRWERQDPGTVEEEHEAGAELPLLDHE